MKSDFPIDNKPELRNCPFCGNEAYLIGLFVPYDDDEMNEYQVECGIHFNQSWEYDTIVDLWNGEYYKKKEFLINAELQLFHVISRFSTKKTLRYILISYRVL